MVDRRVARLCGASGILYVLLFIPAYVVGYPDAPTSTSGVQEAFDYFGDEQSTFLIFNGVLTIFSAFFFVWFAASLRATKRFTWWSSLGPHPVGRNSRASAETRITPSERRCSVAL